MGRDGHPDVEYVVEAAGTERAYASFDEALAYAFSVALSTGKTHLDVLVYSEEGASNFGGDDAADDYRDDPEASIFRRFEISVNDVGRMP